MDFKQIEAFVYVYRLKSFSRAGDALYLSQPTISSHINSLENELGVKLFDRSSRDVAPTEAGSVFYRFAVNLLEIRDGAVSSLGDYSKKIEGRLEIAASTIPGQYLLPRVMKGFLEKYPLIRYSLYQYDTKEVIRELQEKRFEIGIVGARMDEDKLEYEFLTDDRLVLIASKTEKIGFLQSPPSISLEEMKDKRFITREPGSGTRQEFETALKKRGLNPGSLKVVAQMNSTEAIKHAVSEGLGVSVVSSLSVQDYLGLGLIQAFTIEGLDLERAFYLVTYRNRPLSPGAVAFREYILNYYRGNGKKKNKG